MPDRPSRSPEQARWAGRLVVAAVVVVALWPSVESTAEARSLSIHLTLPGWLALALLSYLAHRWIGRWRDRPSAGRQRTTATEGRRESGSGSGAGSGAGGAAVSAEPLVVRSGRTTHLVDVADIRWVTAEGKYARIGTPHDSLLSQYSIGELEAKLKDQGFARIHRSSLVSLSAVRSLRQRAGGTAEAVLADGTALAVARSRRAEVERLLGL